ncbi:hypothetical protein MP638_002370 [Amoeboaphelidium occidentale]|nr:hypothetical protein MP638_002370 [Amoeboaphelidium occidentale]
MSTTATKKGKLEIGSRVDIPSMQLSGVLRYHGKTRFKEGTWAGVELDKEGSGKNDGSVGGFRYFHCAPGQGIFIKAENVQPVKGTALAAGGGGGSDVKRKITPPTSKESLIPSFKRSVSGDKLNTASNGMRRSLSGNTKTGSRIPSLNNQSSDHRSPKLPKANGSALKESVSEDKLKPEKETPTALFSAKITSPVSSSDSSSQRPASVYGRIEGSQNPSPNTPEPPRTSVSSLTPSFSLSQRSLTEGKSLFATKGQEQLKASLDVYHSQTHLLKLELSHLTAKYDALKTKYTALNEQLKSERTQNGNVDSDAAKERDELKKRCERLQNEVEALKNVESKVEEMASDVETVLKERESMSKTVDGLQLQVHELVAERERLAKENESLKTEIEQKVSVVPAAEPLISDEDFKSLERARDQFKEQNARLITELEQLKNLKDEEIKELSSDRDALRAEPLISDEDFKSLERARDQFKEENARLITELEQLKNHKENEIKELSSDRDALRGELQSLKELSAKFTESFIENERILHEMEHMKIHAAQASDMKDSYEILRKEHENLKAELEQIKLAQQNANDKVKEIPELLSRISELQKDADEIRKSRTQLEEKDFETSTKLANSQQEVERLKRELVKKREIEGSLSDLEKERNSLFDINEELTRNLKDLQDGNKKLSGMIEELKLSDTQKANDFESLQKKLEDSLNQTQTVTKDKAKLETFMNELEEKLSEKKLSESLQQNAALLDKSNELQTELSQTKDSVAVLSTENASLKDKLNTSVVAGEELDSLAEAVEIWKNRFKELADCLQKQPTIANAEEKDSARLRRNSTKTESMVFSAEHKLLKERVGMLERLLEQQKQATEENDLHVAQLVKEKDQWLMAWEEVVEEKNMLTEEISRLKVMYSSQISIGIEQGHTKCAHCESSEHPTDECPVAEETF